MPISNRRRNGSLLKMHQNSNLLLVVLIARLCLFLLLILLLLNSHRRKKPLSLLREDRPQIIKNVSMFKWNGHRNPHCSSEQPRGHLLPFFLPITTLPEGWAPRRPALPAIPNHHIFGVKFKFSWKGNFIPAHLTNEISCFHNTESFLGIFSYFRLMYIFPVKAIVWGNKMIQ